MRRRRHARWGALPLLLVLLSAPCGLLASIAEQACDGGQAEPLPCQVRTRPRSGLSGHRDVARGRAVGWRPRARGDAYARARVASGPAFARTTQSARGRATPLNCRSLTCVCPCPAQLAGGCCRAFADISIVVDTSSSYQFQIPALKAFTDAFIGSFDYTISTATAGPYVSLVNFTGGDDWSPEQARAALTPREADAPCRVAPPGDAAYCWGPVLAMSAHTRAHNQRAAGVLTRSLSLRRARRCSCPSRMTCRRSRTQLTTISPRSRIGRRASNAASKCEPSSSTPTLPAPLTGCRMGPHIACVRRWPVIHTHHVC